MDSSQQAAALMESLHELVGTEGILTLLLGLNENWTPTDKREIRRLVESVQARQPQESQESNS